MEINLNKKGNYNNAIRQFSIDQFIGAFPVAVSDSFCSELVGWFNAIVEQGLTFSSLNVVQSDGPLPGIFRKDELVQVPNMLPAACFPNEALVLPLWRSIIECFNIYVAEYNLQDRTLISNNFNVHRVRPAGGYHVWHHEHSAGEPYRVLAWHLNLEAPEKGGETEFLHQSMRFEPKVGQLLIWPAGFTHKHRGNPPLDSHKTYVTGWFMDPLHDGSVQM